MLKKEFRIYFSCLAFLMCSSLDAYTFQKITVLSSSHACNRGPDSVLRSLMAGLSQQNVSFNYNPLEDEDIGDVVVVLSDVGQLHRAIKLKKEGKIRLLLAGPNLMILPDEHNRVFSSPEIDVAIINSNWTQRAYTEVEPSLGDHIAIWYAGVNTDFWMPAKTIKSDSQKVLVYWKTEPESWCIEVERALQEFGFDPVRLCYGTYTQEEFKNKLDEVRFAVFLSKSESQGIALAEAWAMDVPTINWDSQILEAHGRVYSESSSCPYLTPSTGLRWKTIDEFKSILARFDSYTFSPRLWVLGNMSDRVSAKMLLDIIAKTDPKPSIRLLQDEKK